MRNPGASRFLLVGEAPAPDPRKRRLEFALAAAAVGMPPNLATAAALLRQGSALADFWARTVSINLLAEWPGYSGRGSSFPRAAARAAAASQTLQDASGRYGASVVLLAGTRVATAYGAGHVNFFVPIRELCDGVDVFVVPHPSRASSFWNEAGNRDRCADFLVKLTARS